MELKFEQVVKRYGDKTVLRAVNWQVCAGEIWRVDGPSGAGKTTLLRLMMGLETPTSGRIVRARGLRFAPVFQEGRLLPRLNAVQNLSLTCPHSPAEIRQALCELLDEADLSQPAATLSGGMQRRVAVMRALLAPADVLVLDEPFAGLDADNIARVQACILRRRAGRTLIVASHERVAVFSDAKCLRLDQISAIMEPPNQTKEGASSHAEG